MSRVSLNIPLQYSALFISLDVGPLAGFIRLCKSRLLAVLMDSEVLSFRFALLILVCVAAHQ